MTDSRPSREQNPWVDKVSPTLSLLGDWGVDCGIAGIFFLERRDRPRQQGA